MTSGPAGPATSGTERASRSRRSSSRRSRTSSTTTGATRPANRRGGAYRRKQALSTFNNHIEILAMIEDTNDGEFLAPPPSGGAVRPNAGPLWVGTVHLQPLRTDRRAREAANSAIAEVLAKAGLGRFMKFTFRTANASHPVGGCRMADSKELGVVDHQNEVFDYPGLFCMDSSSIPTSLGVNPSLTDLRGRRAGMPALDRTEHRLRPARQARRVRRGNAGRSSRSPHRTGSPDIGQADRRQGPLLRNRLSLAVRPPRGRNLTRGQRRSRNRLRSTPCAASQPFWAQGPLPKR